MGRFLINLGNLHRILKNEMSTHLENEVPLSGLVTGLLTDRSQLARGVPGGRHCCHSSRWFKETVRVSRSWCSSRGSFDRPCSGLWMVGIHSPWLGKVAGV
ncbi:hypothetical protein Droror1_Dr00018780 [Drosera rotundifolia]